MHRQFLAARVRCGALVLLILALGACATGTTDPDFGTAQPIPFPLGRIQSQSLDGLTVHLAVPTDPEVSDLFGVPLFDEDVQPIWLRIENNSDIHYWLLPIAIDPEYYTADEAGYVATRDLDDDDSAAVTGAEGN